MSGRSFIFESVDLTSEITNSTGYLHPVHLISVAIDVDIQFSEVRQSLAARGELMPIARSHFLLFSMDS